MYKVQIQSGGNWTDISKIVHESEGAAIAECIEAAEKFRQEKYKNSKAGLVRLTIRPGEYEPSVWDVWVSHYNQVGAWKWYVIKI